MTSVSKVTVFQNASNNKSPFTIYIYHARQPLCCGAENWKLWNKEKLSTNVLRQHTETGLIFLCNMPSRHIRGRGIAPPTPDASTRRGWVVSSMPPPHYPRKETQYPLYRRLGGLQGWSELVQNISLPLGFWTSDHPAHSEALYLLCYSGNLITIWSKRDWHTLLTI
jgi:hypothetical protein